MLFYRQINPQIFGGVLLKEYILFTSSMHLALFGIPVFDYSPFFLSYHCTSQIPQIPVFEIYLLNRYWVASKCQEMCKALINGHNSFISFPMHMIIKQQSGKGPFTSYFRPVIFMETELKPVPDSTHMYLNPWGNIRGHLFTLSHCTGGWGGGGKLLWDTHIHRVESCQVLRWVPAEAKVSRKQAAGVTQGKLPELPSLSLDTELQN